MSQFQSSLYMLTQSVGAVSMVNIQQIKKQQNLDYLQHLCSFIDRMNINPIWFENQDHINKLKILQIYQLGITYSNNLSISYQRQIQQRQIHISNLRRQQKNKITEIRNHKDQYQISKEKYRLKKHQIYKNMYENLKYKIRGQESFNRNQEYQHRNSYQTPEIVYYYQNDPYMNPINPGNLPSYHSMNPSRHPSMRESMNLRPGMQNIPPNLPPGMIPHPQMPPNHFHSPHYPNNFMPPQPNQPPWTNPPSGQSAKNLNIIAPNQNQQQSNLDYFEQSPKANHMQSDHSYNKFLNSGKLQKCDKSEIIDSKVLNNDIEEMDKSNIITSGQKLMEKIDKQKKLSQNSIAKSNKKRQSIRLDSRDQQDDFGDLTANSRKKPDSKMSKKSFDLEQQQFDSIAHIKLESQSSSKKLGIPSSNPNRFMSKIQSKDSKQKKPTVSNDKLQIPNQVLISDTSADLSELGLGSNIVKSKFSKNNPAQGQGQKIFSQKPLRNYGENKKSNLRASQNPVNKSNNEGKKSINTSNMRMVQNIEGFQGEKLYANKPKRANKQPLNEEEASQDYDQVGQLDNKNNLLNSNAGRVESRKFDKKKPQESVDIFNSNVGHQKSQNNKSEQKLFNQKPKRVSQIQVPKNQNLEVKKSNNQLKVSIAQSQELKNSNMLYSQAVTIKFNEQPAKTPPKLEKEKNENNEQEQYQQQFEDFNDIEDLEHSRLPISNKPKLQKSQVNINIPEAITHKELAQQKYLALPNEKFQLKNQNQSAPNKNIQNSVSVSGSLDAFDEILQIPMNSRIAKRPSAIQRFSPLKSKMIQKPSTQQKVESMSNINSPSIHVIDPTGHTQRVQERKVKQQQMKKQLVTSINMISQKEVPTKQQKILNNVKDVIQQEQQLDFNLMQKSNIGNNSKIDAKNKILEMIKNSQAASPIFKDSRSFNNNFFDKIIVSKFKIHPNQIKTISKWKQIEQYYKNEKLENQVQLQKINVQESAQEVQEDSDSTPKSKLSGLSKLSKVSKLKKNQIAKKKLENLKQSVGEQNNNDSGSSTPRSKISGKLNRSYSNASKRGIKANIRQTGSGMKSKNNKGDSYVDLTYSHSNIKVEQNPTKIKNNSIGNEQLTKSITIKVQQDQKNPNKYSRSNKPKVQVNNNLRKINAGIYDRDDPLNIALIQNKNLLQKKQQDYEDDFDEFD